jgi:octaprenyl-diphosphate synthase
MSTLNKIKKPVADELDRFEVFFRETASSDVSLLNVVVNYMLRTKGKQIRPLFVFLSAKMLGEISRSTYVAATTIELLHSASLIHDDVVDESYERRGVFSVGALWKNKIAVLMGDYLLSKGLLVSTAEKEYDTLDIISTSVKEMIEGELLQFKKSRKLDIDEESYLEIIKKKTASLIGTSMAVGANSVTKDQSVIERMKEIGILAGLAFQIKDDIFDYQDKGIIGKPTGNDIKEKKITLPLIHIINNSSPRERRRIIQIVNRQNRRRDKVDELIELVNKEGGIEYATLRMNDFSNEAKRLLNTFPPSEANSSLSELIDYIISRKK